MVRSESRPSASGLSPPCLQQKTATASTTTAGTTKAYSTSPVFGMIQPSVVMKAIIMGSMAEPRFCEMFQPAMAAPRVRLGK